MLLIPIFFSFHLQRPDRIRPAQRHSLLDLGGLFFSFCRYCFGTAEEREKSILSWPGGGYTPLFVLSLRSFNQALCIVSNSFSGLMPVGFFGWEGGGDIRVDR